MAGIAGHVAQTGSVAFTAMSTQSWPGVLILIGFLVNAGAPPLSAWIPDAYPEASWSGMVFLSAFTTKTAVYALLQGFVGAEILVFVGLYMVFYGIVYAILENDMRRILAYSIVNQVGFMVERRVGLDVLGMDTFFREIPAQRFMVVTFPFRNRLSFTVGRMRAERALRAHRAQQKYAETSTMVISGEDRILYLESITPA